MSALSNTRRAGLHHGVLLSGDRVGRKFWGTRASRVLAIILAIANFSLVEFQSKRLQRSRSRNQDNYGKRNAVAASLCEAPH